MLAITTTELPWSVLLCQLGRTLSVTFKDRSKVAPILDFQNANIPHKMSRARQPATGQRQIQIEKLAYGKSASNDFTRSCAIIGAPGEGTKTGWPFSNSSTFAVTSTQSFARQIAAISKSYARCFAPRLPTHTGFSRNVLPPHHRKPVRNKVRASFQPQLLCVPARLFPGT